MNNTKSNCRLTITLLQTIHVFNWFMLSVTGFAWQLTFSLTHGVKELVWHILELISVEEATDRPVPGK